MKWYEYMKQRRFWGYEIALVVFVVLLFVGVFLYAFDRPARDGAVVMEVSDDTTGREIAISLREKGVIRSATFFRAALWFTGESKGLQSGYYFFRPGLSVRDVIAEMKSGKGEMVSVTVPEGATVLQIRDILVKAGVADGNHFDEVAQTYAPLSYMEERSGVRFRGEGFLFADTYYIPRNYSAKQVCRMMYEHTDKMLTADIRKKAEAKGISIYDLMTLASMVEREARFKEDQVPIASVMLARLEKGMPLQIDATVQYALGENKAELSIGDTKVDSPYNTYLYPGLPPGPIASPGIDAVEAVLTAVPGDYLYYVAKSDGHHVFTKTFEEHEAAIREIYG